ncbi:hypothetical protein N7530_012216 [Penicillium desertorum]|uniref:Mid2 domain-containing protein n=1 Tax=Penicillium desertorum TaxID=1303715 RepID=A0A9X0BGC8_9EURO|nr:hypothetical protein N7530_012216 [Penicillium desertorum]
MMLPLYALWVLPLAHAWTFSYTNATDDTEIARGQESQNCTNSPLGKDKPFSWDPEGSSLCISIYRDTKCDSRAGYSCGAWRKSASNDFAAFDVKLEREIISEDQSTTVLSTSSTSATPTSTSTSSSASPTSASATATPTESAAASADSANSGSSSTALSGGAIAGIVIGVVAGVAIIVALVVIFMRKRNKKILAAANQHGGYGPHEADATGSSISDLPPGSHVVELVGDEGSAELGSSPISEMDGSSVKRGFNRF